MSVILTVVAGTLLVVGSGLVLHLVVRMDEAPSRGEACAPGTAPVRRAA